MSSPAKLLYAFMTCIFMTGFMFVYEIMLYPTLNISLANMALAIGVETAYVDTVCMLATWFPRTFLGALYIWLIVVAYDTEEDTMEVPY